MSGKVLILTITILLMHSFAIAVDKKAQVDSVNQIPYEYIVSNLHKSTEIFERNITRAQSIKYDYGEAVAWDKLSLSAGMAGDHEKSATATFNAIRIFSDLNAFDELSMIYGGYGYGIKRRDLNQALKFMRKGIGIAEKNNLVKNLTTLYDNYGVLVRMEGKMDSAFFYFKKALDLKYQLGDSVGIPYSLNKIAEMYASEEKYDEAFKYLKESDKIRAREQGEYGRAENLIYYGEIFIRMGKYRQAEAYFLNAVDKGKQIDQHFMVQYCYEQLSEIYETTKRLDLALQNYKYYTAYKDSVLNLETNSKISELQIAYESEQKDRLLAETQLAVRSRTVQLTMAVSFFILILLSVFFSYYAFRSKQHRLRNELELNNKLKQAELEQNITDEKIRISKDLHDNIGSQLTFMISSIDNLETMAKNDHLLTHKLNQISSFGRETIDELRNSIWAMKQERGSIKLLLLKINQLKLKFSSTLSKPQLYISNKIEKNRLITSSQMLHIFRFVQEAVQNTVKHAEADTVNIVFFSSDSEISISIKDDGKGFDTSREYDGNGITNLKSRGIEAGGSVELKSGEDGTEVLLRIGH